MICVFEIYMSCTKFQTVALLLNTKICKSCTLFLEIFACSCCYLWLLWFDENFQNCLHWIHIFVIIFRAISDYYRDHIYPWTVPIFLPIAQISLTASVYTTVVTCFDRYIAICRPALGGKLAEKRQMRNRCNSMFFMKVA